MPEPLPADARSTTEGTCAVVSAGAATQGRQGLSYAPAVSAETVGARALHMQMVTIPPGGRAKPHRHDGHETAVHILSGRSGMWWGDALEFHVEGGPGDFMFIPFGVPHQPYNLSDTEPCVAVIARTDPNQQESVVLLPHLDDLHAAAPAT